MTDLWTSSDAQTWTAALSRYDTVIAAQKVARLPELDAWYRTTLPALIASRETPHVMLEEMVGATEWKMARGVWRAPNLVLVRGNAAEKVVEVSGAALALVPQPTAPIEKLATLAGVGPATASAVVSAFDPARYPFFDELVAAQVPGLGRVAWTLGYYARYATALRERAAALGDPWTPAAVATALWTHVGGKANAR